MGIRSLNTFEGTRSEKVSFLRSTQTQTSKMMLKIFALSALVLVATANPTADSDSTDRAVKTLNFVSKTEPLSDDRVKREAGAYRRGLKCYNQEPGQSATVIDCDYLGGASYCAKMVAPSGIARTCGVELVMDAFQPLGLTSAGCRSMSGYTFCLCSGNKCN